MAAERRIVASAVVAASPEQVWELLCDTSRYAEWVDATLEVTRSDGPARLGSTYEERNRIAGPWKDSSRWEVAEFDPPHRQVHDGEGFFAASYVRVVMELTPEGEATEVIITLVYRPRFALLGELGDRLVAGAVERGHRRTVENLSRLVERELVGAS